MLKKKHPSHAVPILQLRTLDYLVCKVELAQSSYFGAEELNSIGRNESHLNGDRQPKLQSFA